MNNRRNLLTIVLPALLAVLALASCSNSESYAERLNTERIACNAYLATKRVVNSIPPDSVFEEGTDAPFYRITNDGNVYMQVINSGDRAKDRAKSGQYIYFRYTRYNVESWYSSGQWITYESNEEDMASQSYYFIYKNYTLPVSSQWGYGIQLPLDLLGAECEVNLLVRSQYGLLNEIAYVQPYLFHIRYFHSQI